MTTENIKAESTPCPNLCWQQRFINEHVRKKYSKSQPTAGKYLLQKGSKMKAVSNYVLALRKMQQDKAAANPRKTNQHEKLLQSGWVQFESLQKTLQQNHPICAQVFVDNQRW